MPISNQTHDVQEEQTCAPYFHLLDENGDPILLADVDSLTLTLYDKATEDIINTRDEQDVLNANNVTAVNNAKGLLVTWSVQPEDLAIQTATAFEEEHIGLFVIVWDSGQKQFQHEVRLKVANIAVYPGA